MERSMTYKTLMAKVKDGYAEVNAWGHSITWHLQNGKISGESFADVTFYKSDGTRKRECIDVTRIPANTLV